MRFNGLDLNLLVALDALLETRSVTRAAERLHLSQPAMSAALVRLREYFADELLVLNGKRMHPTVHAEALLPQVRECLRGLEALITSAAAFDPATAQRTFVIAASDYITVTVLAPMITKLAQTAPGVRIEVMATGERSQEQIAEATIDLVLTPETFLHPNHPADLLFEERHVVVGWSGNPLFRKGRITEDEVFAAGHVAVAIGASRTASFADRQLATLGKTRRIEVTAPAFAAVPWLLEGSMRLALMHERLARTMAERFAIAYAALPFDFPLMREMAQYNRARAGDDGLTWMRREIALAASIDEVDIIPSKQ